MCPNYQLLTHKWPSCFAFGYVQPVSVLQTKKSRGSASAVIMENTDDSHREASYCRDTRRTKVTWVSPQYVHCVYCGMPKGTSLDEATLNSERIKPVALAVIKLR